MNLRRIALLLLPLVALAREPEDQAEKHWVDGRWSQTELGQFQASSLQLPNGSIAKALSIKVGDNDEGAVCYDTASGALRAGWTGGFLKFDPARYGLAHKPKLAGQVEFFGSGDAAWQSGKAAFLGLSLRGPRVILRWRLGETEIRELPWIETESRITAFTRTMALAAAKAPERLSVLPAASGGILRTIDDLVLGVAEQGDEVTAVGVTGDASLVADAGRVQMAFAASDKPRTAKMFFWRGKQSQLANFARLVQARAEPEDLTSFDKPAAPRWQPLETKGQLGSGSQPWVIDTVTLPYDNPWKALLFCSGIDFLPNGDAAVCTMHGDVWVVSGVDAKLAKLTWRRFATGLYQPLGLRVVGGKIHVLGRDQITALSDTDGNGEADEYNVFTQQIETSIGGHDYVTSLETDSAGNFYYVDPKGVHRISADGAKRETIATGWRNPNGMSVGPDGTITVAPQEGNWTPASRIDEVRPGGYYGYGGPRKAAERPLGYDLPLCWLPRSVDNSTGSQVWVTNENWGLPKGSLLNLSFGRCAMQLVLRDKVEGQPQGGVVPLPGRFLSGVMRGTFNPHDGQLYVAGAQGWQTAATRDGCVQRVRFTGRKPRVPIALAVHANGLKVTFSDALDRATAEEPGSYHLEQWNYEYAERYGSKDLSISRPGTVGRDVVELQSVRLLEDGRSVFLEVPNLQPVMQMHVQWNINAADRANVRGELFHTIHKLRPPHVL